MENAKPAGPKREKKQSSHGGHSRAFDLASRVVAQVIDDRVTLVAAGVTFYVLLALLPALTSLVSIYGLISDPVAIGRQLVNLSAVLPSQSLELVAEQLEAIVSQKTSSLSVGFAAGLLVTIWSARNGVAALLEAINIAYGETEGRSFVHLTLISLVFTVAGLIFLALLLAAIAVCRPSWPRFAPTSKWQN